MIVYEFIISYMYSRHPITKATAVLVRYGLMTVFPSISIYAQTWGASRLSKVVAKHAYSSTRRVADHHGYKRGKNGFLHREK